MLFEFYRLFFFLLTQNFGLHASYNLSQLVSPNSPLISLSASVDSFLSCSDLRTLFLLRGDKVNYLLKQALFLKLQKYFCMRKIL
jgi:hypothetical protein